jgi:hypothetical protein
MHHASLIACPMCMTIHTLAPFQWIVIAFVVLHCIPPQAAESDEVLSEWDIFYIPSSGQKLRRNVRTGASLRMIYRTSSAEAACSGLFRKEGSWKGDFNG